MAAAMTLRTRDAQGGDPLPAALLTDGFGDSSRPDAQSDGRRTELKFASCSVGPIDESPAAARAFVRSTLQAWRLDGLTDDLALVVTELVTNALRHGVGGPDAAGSVHVELYGTESRVMCAVSDPSDEVPVRVSPDIAHDSGRGLQIVEALSMYWGWTALARDGGSGGKSVWAVFPLDSAPEARAV
jgi:signal transduction histidine kinase